MGDFPKRQWDFEAVVMPGISIAFKVGESSGTTFPLSSLDATVIGNLLKVEKLGYKPKAKVGEHFMHSMQQYKKESATILSLVIALE